MVPRIAFRPSDGRRGSIKRLLLVALLLVAALAGHWLYGQYKERQEAEAQAAVEAQAAQAATQPVAPDGRARPAPTPSSNSPRVAEMETISNIQSGR